MASKELSILIDAKDNASRTLNSVTGKVKTLEGTVKHAASSAARNLSIGFAVGIAGIATQVKAGLDSLQELENVQAQTRAALLSTGGAAGLNADQIRNLAQKYEDLNATIDDKVIQSGENLLLTFTSIRKDAFEPALLAALNLNQRLGGGEQGLQGTIIQVGKALQDPIKGLTALRRVGVSFSEKQQKQIKDLVKHNKLYEAQRLILGELTREFGGSFAAAGQTATGKFAKLKDAIDDARMRLAEAFLPALEKVAGKLSTLLRDPAVIKRIQDFGKGLADGFEKLVDFAGRVPWDSVISAFTLMGSGAKLLLDAFLKLPPWVQTAVITGWGLNKLTGGGLGSILLGAATNLIKGVLGIKAGVVNVQGAVVNVPGGGAPGVPGAPVATPPGFLPPGPIPLAAGAALPLVMFDVVPSLFPGKAQQGAGLGSQPALVDNKGVKVIDDQTHAYLSGLIPSFDRLAHENGLTNATIDKQARDAASNDRALTATANRIYQQSAAHTSNQRQQIAEASSFDRANLGYARAQLARKTVFNAHVTVPVTVNSVVSIDNVTRKQVAYIRANAGSGGFI